MVSILPQGLRFFFSRNYSTVSAPFILDTLFPSSIDISASGIKKKLTDGEAKTGILSVNTRPAFSLSKVLLRTKMLPH